AHRPRTAAAPGPSSASPLAPIKPPPTAALAPRMSAPATLVGEEPPAPPLEAAQRIARRTVQIACGSRGRNRISPPAACRPEAVGASEAQAAPCRSPDLRLALSAVPFRARSRGCLQA